MLASSTSTGIEAISSLSLKEQNGAISTLQLAQSAWTKEADPEFFDLYFIGGGQDKQQQIIAQDLVKRAKHLKAAVDNGAAFLTICGGYQLLGHYYKPYAKAKS